MDAPLLLDPVQLLCGPGKPARSGAVLIETGVLTAFDDDARERAATLGAGATSAPLQLVAPCLVDPHSVLPSPFSGPGETLISLLNCAAAAGYGQIALLPRGITWRDRPECLMGFHNSSASDVQVHLWAGFSRGGEGQELTPHADLLEHGAIGLADDDALVSLPLLERGLLLGDMGSSPVLMAPRDEELQGDGLMRDGVETLRSGWPGDPLSSETQPLSALLALHQRHPNRRLRLMNLSTAAAVQQLRTCSSPPLSSVSWWHLVADRSQLPSCDSGLRVRPSLGGEIDRTTLIEAVLERTITAVAVHSIPLDAEDMLLPIDQRQPGLSGHHLVLPALWDVLVSQHGWPVEKLWEALSFGPSALIEQPPEQLEIGSRRWLLFDPSHHWTVQREDVSGPRAVNLPWIGKEIKGRVTACGLNLREGRSLMAARSEKRHVR